MRRRHPLTLFALLFSVIAPAAETTKKTWDFEKDEPGKIARGFTNEVGQWEVAKDGDNYVLFQKAKNEDAVFNIAQVHGTSYKDIDLSVRLKAVAGEIDRGGGVVWRAKDAKNYYIARYNPLEDNFRVYKVQDGKRTMFKNVKTPGDDMWHTVRVTMVGSKITCYLDGQKHSKPTTRHFRRRGGSACGQRRTPGLTSMTSP